MTLVICKRHGTQSGPHCCRHVLDAVAQKGAPVEYRLVTFDVNGDGDVVYQHLLCLNCVEEYGLTNLKRVQEDVWGDDKRFPWTCPVCGPCLDEYKKHKPEQPGPIGPGR